MRFPWQASALALLALSLLFHSREARADNPSVAVNDSFFDGIPINPESEVLLVSADPKALAHGEADAELIQYAAPDSERRPDSCGLEVSPQVPFTLDCGVKMLGLEVNGDTASYYFLLKAHHGDWYQIILSPQSGATTWVKDRRTAGLTMMIHPFVDWLMSQNALTTTHEVTDPIRAIPVFKAPEDSSTDLTDCASYEDGEGAILAADKAKKGDWLHVICIENGCFAESDPVRTCIPKFNPQGSPCIQGWARWRSKTGRLLLYPHDATAEACS